MVYGCQGSNYILVCVDVTGVFCCGTIQEAIVRFKELQPAFDGTRELKLIVVS